MIPVVENTISLGNLLTMGCIIGGAIGGWFALKQLVAILAYRVTTIEVDIRDIKSDVSEDLKEMKASIANIATILSRQATIDEQIVALRRDLTELKHGEGFVMPLGSVHK